MSQTITKTLKIKMNTRKVTDLCDDFKIPYIYCRIIKHYKTGKKTVEGIPPGIMAWTYDQAMEFNKNVLPTFATHVNCLLKNGEDNDKLVVIDFDDKDDASTHLNTFGDDWKSKSSSRGLPHLWRLKKENDFSKDLTGIKIGDKITKIDLRYTNIFEKIDSKIEYFGNVTDIPEFDFEKFHPRAATVKPIPRVVNTLSAEFVTLHTEYYSKRVLSHLQNINAEFAENDTDWFLIGNAIKGVWHGVTPSGGQGGETPLWFQIFEEWSRKSTEHICDDTEPWLKRFEGESRSGLSTILRYSESSNLDEYNNIEKIYFDAKKNDPIDERNVLLTEGKRLLLKSMLEYDNKLIQISDFLNGTDTGMAQTYLKMKPEIIKVDKVFYIYEGRLWAKDEDLRKIQLDMREKLLNYYQKALDRFIKLLKEMPEDSLKIQQKIISLQALVLDIQKHSKQINVMNQLILEIPESNINLDRIKPYYFVFDNVAFDLETGKEVIIKKDDYITQSCHSNYIKSSPAKLEEIKRILSEILPDADYRNSYLSILKSCLTGIRVKNFILANGAGNNGKGLITQLMESLLGKDYFYRGNVLTLTERLKAGSSVEIANMNLARMICFSEPEEGSELQLGVIKALSGDDSICARTIYSKNTKTQLTGTIITEVNGKPAIHGAINDGAVERWININFPNCFTANQELVDNITKFKVNTTYVSIGWRESTRCALFDMLLEVKGNNIFIPEIIVNDTKQYLLNTDPFTKWFEETYEYVPVDGLKSVITAQAMYQTLKESDFYENLSKKAKRGEFSKAGMIQQLKDNIKLRPYYFESKSIQQIDYKNILTFYKLKEEEAE